MPLASLRPRRHDAPPPGITCDLCGTPGLRSAVQVRDASGAVMRVGPFCAANARRAAKGNPFVSEAQRRHLHALAARGQMSTATVARLERETVGPLPSHAPRPTPSVLVAPKAVRDAFRRGLELERQGYGGKGLVQQTIDWARKLADGRPIDLAKAHDMHGWLARHGASPTEIDARARSEQTPASVAWYLWGANPSIPYDRDNSRDPVFAWNRKVLAYFADLHGRKRNPRRPRRSAR